MCQRATLIIISERHWCKAHVFIFYTYSQARDSDWQNLTKEKLTIQLNYFILFLGNILMLFFSLVQSEIQLMLLVNLNKKHTQFEVTYFKKYFCAHHLVVVQVKLKRQLRLLFSCPSFSTFAFFNTRFVIRQNFFYNKILTSCPIFHSFVLYLQQAWFSFM